MCGLSMDDEVELFRQFEALHAARPYEPHDVYKVRAPHPPSLSWWRGAYTPSSG